MIEFKGFGHVNIIVDDVEVASAFYEALFGAVRVQDFPHLRNRGFALSAGFLEDPDTVDVTVRFLEIPGANLFMELMQYHSPPGNEQIVVRRTNDLGGPRHLCLRVADIDAAFQHVLATDGARPIHASPEYRPHRIDSITPDQFRFFDPKKEADAEAKADVCEIIGGIWFFYLIDRYGIQWELEAGHDDIGS